MKTVSQHGTLDSCGLNSPEWIAARCGLEASVHTSSVSEAQNITVLPASCLLPIFTIVWRSLSLY